MSIKYNGKTVAGNYKVSASTTASDTKAGPIKIATEQELKDTTNNKVAVTPYLLNKALSSINRGLKIGRIGIGFINESQQQERYLNGQVIIQDQFESFTTWVKDLIKLYPNLSCTNEEFETACSMSVYGQCGKFVVDDNAGSIRLPKVVNMQGLFDLTQVGLTVEAGLPNIEGSFTSPQQLNAGFNMSKVSGAFSNLGGNGVADSIRGTTTTATQAVVCGFDASLSNPIYGNSTTVQQEAIQYPYWIQVATGVETSVDITREIELNIPYSLGDSKYSPRPLNNSSWLKSAGQWNSKAVYTSFYDWLLTQRNKGYKQLYAWVHSNGGTVYTLSENPSVGDAVFGYTPLYSYGIMTAVNGTEATIKNITENTNSTVTRDIGADKTGYIAEFSDVAVRFSSEINFTSWNYSYDYDFVINTAEETFRLPLFTKERILIDKQEPTANNYAWYNLYSDGWLEQGAQRSTGNVNISFLKPYRDLYYTLHDIGLGIADIGEQNVIRRVDGFTTGSVLHNVYSYSWGASGYTNLSTSDYKLTSLYFYVGETVQNANLINAGRIEEKVASLIPDNSSLISGYAMPSVKYIDLTLGASNSSYTAPANGYFAWFGFIKASVGYLNLVNSGIALGTQAYSAYNSDSGVGGYCFVPARKGDIIVAQYYANTSITTTTFRFIYAVGSENEV